MAKWDWAGLIAVAAIGIGGYFLGLPWWAIGIVGAAYATVRIILEVAWRHRRGPDKPNSDRSPSRE